MGETYYQFKFTGDPWIDAGVVSFWDYIEDKEEIVSKFNLRLERKNYSILGQSSEGIERFLSEILDEIKNNRYIQQSKNKVCVYSKAKDDFEIINKINIVSIARELFSIGAGASKPEYEKCQFPQNKLQLWEDLKGRCKGQRIDFKIDDKNRISESFFMYLLQAPTLTPAFSATFFS